MLRYLAYSGDRQSSEHGGLGKRADEEIRLPEVYYPHGGGERRFCIDARGDHAALLEIAGRKAAVPGPGDRRWRARPITRRRRSARGHRDYVSAARVDCQ